MQFDFNLSKQYIIVLADKLSELTSCYEGKTYSAFQIVASNNNGK